MERVLVYPYDRSFDPLLVGNELLPDRKVTSLISPKGWGLKGKEIVQGGQKYIVEEDFEKALEHCEIVWFRDAGLKTSFEQNILKKFMLAVEKDKKILYSRSDTEENRRIDSILAGHKRIWSGREEEEKPVLIEEHRIYHIMVPVVFLCGMSENTGKLKTELEIYQSFLKKGYKAVLIASRAEAKYAGVHAIPAYMFEERQETDKIFLFNRYIKNIELKENPDLIIIGIPGGPIEISLKCVCAFGVTAYEIAKAVQPDCVICNMAAATGNEQFWEDIRISMGSVFGRKIDFFNCIPQILDLMSSNDAHRAEYIHTSITFLKEQMMQIKNDRIVSLSCIAQVDQFVECIIEMLAEEEEVAAL